MSNYPVSGVSFLEGAAVEIASPRSGSLLGAVVDEAVADSPPKVSVTPPSGVAGLAGLFSYVESGFRDGFAMPIFQKGLQKAGDPSISSGELLAWGIESTVATRNAGNLSSFVTSIPQGISKLIFGNS